MNLFERWRCLGVGMLFSALPVMAQITSISTISNCSLGNIIGEPVSVGGGSATIDASGAVTYYHCYQGTPKGSISAARFSVKGTPGTSYSVHYSGYPPTGNETTYVTLYGPNGYTLDGYLDRGTQYRTFDSSGNDSFAFSVKVAIPQTGWDPAGFYTGTFTWVATSAASPDVQSSPTTISITIQKRIQDIGITSSSSLNFGEIFSSGSAFTVTVNPNGNRSSSAGNATLGGGVAITVPSFTVTGEPKTAYIITLPSSITITETTSGTGKTMQVTNFTSNPSTGNLGSKDPGRTTGHQTFTVGATLGVGANQYPADYSGTFSVIVSYF